MHNSEYERGRLGERGRGERERDAGHRFSI
jgi:hypothetical protein